jgi:hypothetical protein
VAALIGVGEPPVCRSVAVGRVDASVLGEGERGRIAAVIWGLSCRPDDSVRGVVELSSIRVRRCAPGSSGWARVGTVFCREQHSDRVG